MSPIVQQLWSLYLALRFMAPSLDVDWQDPGPGLAQLPAHVLDLGWVPPLDRGDPIRELAEQFVLRSGNVELRFDGLYLRTP